MPIKAASLYSDKNLITLTTDELWLATVAEAVLQGQQPPLEVFILEPHNVGFLLKGEANKASVNLLRIVRGFNGGLTADAPTVEVTSRWLDAPDVLAFGILRDSILTRFAAAQVAIPAYDRLIAKRDALVAQLGGNTTLAQTVWATMETKPWPA